MCLAGLLTPAITPTALAAAAAGNSAPAAPRAAEAPSAAASYQSHVIMMEDFARPWSSAEKSALWNAGLPVPDAVTAGTDVFALVGLGNAAPFAPLGGALVQGADHTPRALPASFAAPPAAWSPLYRQNFDQGLPQTTNDGACHFMLLSADSSIWWNYDTTYTFNASPGAAAVINYLPPATGLDNQPGAGEQTAQIVCVFEHMADTRNFMVQFALRMERSATGSFFAGISTDGRTFLGRRWRDTAAGRDSAQWVDNRLYLPFAGESAHSASGAIAVLWEYRTSQPADTVIPVALDDIVIDRYVGTPTQCRSNDPRIIVPGTPGATPVSKGINLPAYLDYTPSGLAGHVARLKASAVGWVRLEFESRMPPEVPAAALEGVGGQLSYFDFQHYDTLLDLLCAEPQPVGVLALLDYKTMLDPSWRANGRPATSWQSSFLAHTRQLVRYYRDRVAYWEIWNEPDFSVSYLAPGAYAQLLSNVYAVIKQTDRGAQVLSGGLGGIDRNAANYLQQMLAQLPPDRSAFDIFAIHPYPSRQFAQNGMMIRDPSYLHYLAPTVLEPFLQILAAAGLSNKPIWVTEIGWNRAADSTNTATLTCNSISQGMVTGPEQALYLPVQMDILFKETAWAPGVPSVTKIFWYQYGDVGLTMTDSQCQGVDWPADPRARVVDWWYGLYSGTDPAHGIVEPQPNRSECTFRAYPDAGNVNRCFSAPAAVSVVN